MLQVTDSQQGHEGESLETEPEARCGHVAVHFGYYILVYGGINRHDQKYEPAPTRELWLLNVYTEQWRKYIISGEKTVPPAMEGASAVEIGRNIYMFGGLVLRRDKPKNSLWKITRKTNGQIVWSKIQLDNHKNHKTPSPRYHHAAWEYEGKLWIFGGYGYRSAPDNNLNEFGDFSGRTIRNHRCNNQLLCYNPTSKEWTNLKCLGSVPEPRHKCATAIAKDRVWMFGGRNVVGTIFNDLHELNMHSFTWIKIQPDQTRPQGRYSSTFNSIFGIQLVLHGGSARSNDSNVSLNDTWIFDLPSQSWRQYKCSADHHPWDYKGIKGIADNIIIIGGRSTCHAAYNFTFHLQLGPKTLQQLAMKTVWKHRTELQWRCLPKKLIVQLGLSE